ncbi:MAG TPA: M20/M25/M40 family metallo-hydrolase [Bryobacteraceae bacterium]|nr:M20/M25/M40 family metallo-hydrolase [Bryobacteraceae bacterium]
MRCSRLLLLVCFAAGAQEDAVDREIAGRIRREAFDRSQVMNYAFYLADLYGPRLTGSAGFRESGRWAAARLRELGFANIQQQPLDWGRGWECSRFAVHLLAPQYAPLTGVPLAWSPGTRGRRAAPAVLARLPNLSGPTARENLAEFQRQYSGKLRRRIVLAGAARMLEPETEPVFRRLTDKELAERAAAPALAPGKPAAIATNTDGTRLALERELHSWLRQEGVIMLLTSSGGSGGTIFTTGSTRYRDPKVPLPVPMAVLAVEHYNRLVRLVERNIPVRIEAELQVRFARDPSNAFNLLADLPGSEKKDEIVLLGAHLDSWNNATGATDNAAGCAVLMDVMRILKALHVPLRRTVRIALWGGHEGAGLGSRTYVRERVVDGTEHAKLSACYNLDYGHGRIRGIYLQGNIAVRPTFETWLSAFADLAASTVSLQNAGGTDHVAFDEAGIPAFQFIQDPVSYGSRTHHSNMDYYDYLLPDDLKQAAAVVATLAFQTAMRAELLPRKPAVKR